MSLQLVPLRYIPISTPELIQFIGGTITFDKILLEFEVVTKKNNIKYSRRIIEEYIKSCQTLEIIPYFYVFNNNVGCGYPSNPFIFKTTQDFDKYIKGTKYKKTKKKKHKYKKKHNKKYKKKHTKKKHT